MGRRRKQTGTAVWLVLLVLIGVVFGAWQYKQARIAKQLQAAQAEQMAKIAADTAKQAEEARVSAERKALEEQIAASKVKDVLRTSLKAADDLYARWKDGKKVANLTSRIGLAGPVAALQALRRDADALIVPDCLKNGKASLLDAMALEIDGFLAFMGDTTMGKYVAQANADKAEKLLTGYEADRALCPSS